MQIDFLRQLEELVKAFGVNVMYLNRKLEPDAEYDQGLRRFLQYPNVILGGIKDMEEYYEEKILYIVRDSFEEYYMSFLVPEKYRRQPEKEFFMIGPYIMEEPESMMDKVMEQNQLPLCLTKELREYYYSIPLLTNTDALEGVVLTQMGYLFGDREGLQLRWNSFRSRERLEKVTYDEKQELSMAAIEERYRYEEEMIAAIQTGDLEKVLKVDKEFRHYRLKPRSEDTLRNAKNLMVVWNTLFRKAVQQADVHPAYIDSLSEMFARKIENCAHVNDLQSSVSREMMHKYCLLVRNYSKRGYTSIVRDALNYIDFHISDQLS